jgi:long-subunit acyl-CoA synthetase (AMP-forming)
VFFSFFFSPQGNRTYEDSSVEPLNSEEGELYIKGPQVFTEYWGKKEETLKSFDTEMWFKTGDIASK